MFNVGVGPLRRRFAWRFVDERHGVSPCIDLRLPKHRASFPDRCPLPQMPIAARPTGAERVALPKVHRPLQDFVSLRRRQPTDHAILHDFPREQAHKAARLHCLSCEQPLLIEARNR